MHQLLADVRERALAAVIAGLINEQEPLLKAEARGSVVLVTERGADVCALRVEVKSEVDHQPQAMDPRQRSAG